MNKRGNFSQLAYSHSGSQGTLGIIYILCDQELLDFLKTWSKVLYYYKIMNPQFALPSSV